MKCERFSWNCTFALLSFSKEATSGTITLELSLSSITGCDLWESRPWGGPWVDILAKFVYLASLLFWESNGGCSTELLEFFCVINSLSKMFSSLDGSNVSTFLILAIAYALNFEGLPSNFRLVGISPALSIDASL